ncbi:MAG: hypothetical protein IPH12_13910 [Saprospirales bacterium]|nr:hypothetical protein [Saprospirales bacterium]MBK8922830.1 hypothetical protein [Saprospirales bacterium]
MSVYQQAESIELVHSGADYFSRLAGLLDEARETVHLQTYIYKDDDTGRRVAAALRRAAARGVQVWVMVDGYGSNDLPAEFIRDLQQAGVAFRFFRNLASFWHWRFGRTLHHKVVVVDAAQALVGGINIADKYRGTAGETAWLDFAVYIRGQVCQQLFHLCADIFYQEYWKKHRNARGQFALLPGGDRSGRIAFRLNDWMRRRTEIYQSYTKGISAARQSLVIVASYFLPGRSVRQRLNAAVRRGVEVRILLTGPSDIELSRVAEQYLAEWLLRRGMRVFQWNHSVMHGKGILTDGQWASLGSYNVNRLSRFRSLELNVDIADPRFVQQFDLYLDDLLLRQCVELTLENIPAFSSRWGRLKARVAYHFSVYLMRVLFPGRR